ncbi:hypothetical protein GKC44_08420 [Lactobacillus parabuchneri]|uniref:Uncharacterized protein n=1 Tax=Lentilactobacillus parabuchneri TaxID=152331 RepID=A0A844EC84_9LACO|nr:hypothetical protein [Lentilactobacillus parabuchneri]
MTTLDYQISKHFYDRLNQRFNVPVSEAQKWVKRFFSNAVKDHCEENGRKALFKKDNIWVVTVPQQRVLVTVYSEDRVADKLTIQNVEVKHAISQSLKQLKYQVIKRQAQQNEECIQELQQYNQAIAHARNNRFLDQKYASLKAEMIPIMYNQAKCEDILSEIEKIENY